MQVGFYNYYHLSCIVSMETQCNYYNDSPPPQVASNGLISFGRPSAFSFPLLFPTRDYWTQNSFLIAPFWGQSDTRKAGVVSYVTLDQTADDVTMESLLNSVSLFVSTQTGETFRGSWMLVAHWGGIHPFPHGSYSDSDLLLKYNNTFVSKVRDGEGRR